ncbi:MAG: hypothetical protein ACWGMZ_08455, partial [Thermoguttaceae bacterium]
MSLLIAILAYLFALALIDHWALSGGLGFGERFFFWSVLILFGGIYFVKYLWPVLALSINPIFAAQTIEQSKPSLKNSLINFLLLRGHSGDLAPVVYQALQNRAAADLSDVPAQTTVDRKPILIRSYVLAALVAVICIYLAVSPKSALLSAGRVLWPWAGVHAPTRVTIENVKPGDATAFYGDSLMISAEVRGLNDNEPVMLHYSTPDEEITGQSVPMSGDEFHHLFQGKLPPGSLGLQQNYNYYVAAGDFQTPKYKIDVQIAPLIDVEKVDYV